MKATREARRELARRAAESRTVALFSGTGGTGTTMAAETLAKDLGRPFHRVDLDALVSKYIGETEKNIDRMFADAQWAGAVVFFDEADAVFGKRSDVRESHDRYANLEVSYLLGRIEAYEGLVILATNRREQLDDAIARRVKLFVELPAASSVNTMPESITVVWSPHYEVDIGPHVFPTAKYRLIRDRLLADGIVTPTDFVEPEPATDAALARVHTAGYLRQIREDDFTQLDRLHLEVPFSRKLAVASRLCCGGTMLAAERALTEGVVVHLGGGFHHAFAAHGEGFCLLNDVAVGAADALTRGTERVLVVDLDVHQGNGTAAIFAGEPRVFTFSMHQQKNYPAEKPPSDADVGLPDRTKDERYLELLAEHLPRILETHRPGLVLYLAGADPFQEDQLGGLALTKEGLRTRDRFVLEQSRSFGAAVAITLAGGYARLTADTIDIHVATVEEAVRAVPAGT